jgi:hypothetical protein
VSIISGTPAKMVGFDLLVSPKTAARSAAPPQPMRHAIYLPHLHVMGFEKLHFFRPRFE